MAPTSDDLSKLFAEALAVHEEQGEAAFEAFCDRHSDFASGLRERMAGLRSLGLLETRCSDLPERIGDYRILRRLGSGGMGVVYLAASAAGERVALKVVRPENLLFPGSRERFEREVQAIGALSHPGLAGVHEVGEAEGLPFLAMEWVRGLTIAEILERLQKEDHTRLQASSSLRVLRESDEDCVEREDSALFAGSYAGWCLRVAAEVARILDHVHAHGILHRDVKPSNIMLTAEGRVILVDFGLAAMAGADELTRTGAQIGSLPYMAPEQLEGRNAELDVRTDVYGLGVTLFEMLTLQPAFAAENAIELRQRIAHGDHRRLRQSAVSADTVTVCSTAMEPDPARRYPSAKDFADDLQRVVDRKPIRARRPGVLRRFGRWRRRQPLAAMSLLVVVLAVLVTPVIVQVAAASEREQKRVQLQDALSSMDRLMASVDKLADITGPSRDDLKRSILEETLEITDRIPAADHGDAELATERARVALRLAELLRQLGKIDDAERWFGEAIGSLTGVPDEASDPSILELVRAGGEIGIARIEQHRGNLDAARLRATAALRVLESGAGTDIRVVRRRVDALQLRARIAAQAGDHEQCLALSQNAVDVLMRARRETKSKRIDWSRELRDISTLLGMVAAGQEQAGVAETHLLRALKVQKELCELGENVVIHQNLAAMQLTVAGFYRRRSDWKKVIEFAEAAVGTADALLEKHPHRLTLELSRSESLTALGSAHLRLRDGDTAMSHAERGIASMKRLVEDEPSYTHLNALASLVELRGMVQQARRDYATALASFREFEKLRERCIEEGGATRENVFVRHGARARCGQMLLAMRKPAEAAQEFRTALEAWRKLAEQGKERRVTRQIERGVIMLCMCRLARRDLDGVFEVLDRAADAGEIQLGTLGAFGRQQVLTRDPRFHALRKRLQPKRKGP